MTSRHTRDDVRPDGAVSRETAATPTTARGPETPPASPSPARSSEEAEARYVEARNAWTAAMRTAGSGRPADLASLAIAQEAYEAASAELAQWTSGARVAIPVTPEPTRSAIDIIVGQELAWRRVHHDDDAPKRGVLGRLANKLRGR